MVNDSTIFRFRFCAIGLLALFHLLPGASCSEKEPAEPEETQPCMFLGQDTCRNTAGEEVVLTLRPDDEQQTIHSFGASDCWTTKFIGRWGNEEKKRQIADLLFSQDTLPDGSPEGIGLSLWRFNIGGGSFEQGEESQIATDWRREECFLNADGSYDWSKQAGQQWFLEAARERGVKYTLGFSLTPPVHMTRNGKAFNGSGGAGMNIREGKMQEYADFMAMVTRHFGLDYLSPVNEPQWSWGEPGRASQEGTQATNAEIADLTRRLSSAFSGQGTTAEIAVAEAGQWEYLYGRNDDGRGDQIARFFWPASEHYIGDLPHVANVISGHSYFTTCPDETMISTRQEVAAKLGQVDASLQPWQTEFGILGNICGEYNGSPRNTGIDYGLYVAGVLHHDLVITGVTAWHWWLAVSPYDYSDALVYINDPSGNINVDNCREDGIVLESKQLWAFGNYARFIRPGMKRIGVSAEGLENPADAARSLMVSAYKDEAASKLVIVIINPEEKEKTIRPAGSSLQLQGETWNVYTTDAEHNLNKTVATAGDIRVPPQSVTTLTGISY